MSGAGPTNGAEPGWDGVERRSGEDRRRKRRYRFIDRRHGFDRRKRYPILGTMRDHPWILVAVLVALNTLSLVDGYLTLAGVVLGVAREANPVLLAAARQHPLLPVAVKLGAMVVVTVGFWHGRKRRSILGLSLLALAAFAALVAYESGMFYGLGLL